MASIRKRGKVWRAEVMVAGARASSTFRTKQEAAQWALTQEAGLAAPAQAHTLKHALETFKRKVTPTHKGAKWEELRLEALMLAEDALIPILFVVNKSLVNPRVTGWVDNIANFHRSRWLCVEKAG